MAQAAAVQTEAAQTAAGQTAVLAQYVNELQYGRIPPEVLRKAKECLLDQLGVQLVASTLEWSRIAYRTVRALGGKPESSILNYGDKTSAPNAAFVNGSFGHGCEFDDLGPRFGHGHPGCVVVPGAVAIAERDHLSGKDLLTAVVAGYEVEARISMSCSRSILKRGFHNAWHIFGPASAVAKLLNLDTDGVIRSLGIAGSFASGLLQYTKSGGETKRIEAGSAASNGILAVLLSKEGFTSPPDILEGGTGFIRAFADSYSFEPLTLGLNKDWFIMQTGFKLVPCCGGIFAPMENVLRLIEKHKIAPDDIEKIQVRVSSSRVDMVGKIYEPRDTVSAQFSLPYTVGLAVVAKRLDLGAFTDPKMLKDPAVLAFAKKIKMEVDDVADAPYLKHNATVDHRFMGKVIITTKDGKQVEDINRIVRGTPSGEPLSWEELTRKFSNNAATAGISQKKIDRAIEIFDKLEACRDINELVANLRVD